MDDKKFEKWGALAGIEFAVLLLVGSFIAGSPPKVTDSAAKITNYFVDNADQLKIGNFLQGLAIIPFLWFLGTLFGRLRAAEGGSGRVSGIALTGGVITAAMSLLGLVFLAFGALYPDGAVGSFQLANIVYGFLGFSAAAFTIGTSVVVMRSKFLPAWVAWLGEISAIVWIVGAVSTASTKDVWAVILFAGFLIWLIWIIVLSVLMYQKSDA